MPVNGMTRLAVMMVALISVFLSVSINAPRTWLGAQVDLLPALMVYASLTGDPWCVSWLAVGGGLWLDAFSMNPLGISILPLLAVGVIIYLARDLILSDQVFVQLLLGGAASALVPAFTLLLLWTFLASRTPGAGPNASWELAAQFELGAQAWGGLVARPVARAGLLLQFVVMAAVGALVTPFLFSLFAKLNRAFNYPAVGRVSFRSDRQIKRGRYI